MEYQKRNHDVKAHVHQIINKMKLHEIPKRKVIIHVENVIPLRLQELFKKYRKRGVKIIEAHAIEGKLLLIGVKQ